MPRRERSPALSQTPTTPSEEEDVEPSVGVQATLDQTLKKLAAGRDRKLNDAVREFSSQMDTLQERYRAVEAEAESKLRQNELSQLQRLYAARKRQLEIRQEKSKMARELVETIEAFHMLIRTVLKGLQEDAAVGGEGAGGPR